MHVDGLVRPLEVVSAADEALDMSEAERLAYAEQRDPSMIRELPGQRAVRYVCRALSASEAVEMSAKTSAEVRAFTAFMFGVVEIADADASGPCAGKRLTPTRSIDRNRPRIWSVEELDGIVEAFGVETVFEIGSFIFERAFLRKKKGSVHRHARRPYSVPQSLRDELASMELPRAEPPSASPEATPST